MIGFQNKALTDRPTSCIMCISGKKKVTSLAIFLPVLFTELDAGYADEKLSATSQLVLGVYNNGQTELRGLSHNNCTRLLRIITTKMPYSKEHLSRL